MIVQPPTTEAELIARAEALAGRSVAELAKSVGETVPATLSRHKGWLGQLLETCLGASAKSYAAPDFERLQIELKTVPVDDKARAQESTYVCTVPLLTLSHQTWPTSWVCKKLSRVLWVPIITRPQLALPKRQIGMPFLWSPSPSQYAQLQQDWQELTDMLCLGRPDEISAQHGVLLQIRPKAANSQALCWGINADGERFLTLPRGFYLRAQFTTAILSEHFFPQTTYHDIIC